MTPLPVYIHELSVVLLVRIFLGTTFFLQGYDKVFRIGVKQVIETIHTPLADKGIPNIFSILGAYFTSYTELTCGTLLIIGFLKYYCLYLLGIDVLFAAFAFGIVEPMWDMKHIFPRFVLLIFLFLVPSQWDIVSVDHLWSLTKALKSIF
jgi:uncharacterized membrane protein YphA (DoxX/SURF4 family)